MIGVNTCGLSGISSYTVVIEVNAEKALPAYEVVGLADTAIKEAKERVRSGIKNSGYPFPSKRITVNLAPASIKKEGTHYDLPMAISLLRALGEVQEKYLNKFVILGEMSLFGEVRGVRGILPMVDSAAKAGFDYIIVPNENVKEACLVPNIRVFGVENLKQAVSIVNGENDIRFFENVQIDFEDDEIPILDFCDVRGQESAKRALEIACSGGHSCLMVGSPGSGKTMLSQRVPYILPTLTYEEAMEVTKIYSISNLVSRNDPLVKKRPFRAVHHTASTASLVGGGSKAMPGEISLAHNGVLFLDELPEFKRATLEVLRQPLEDKFININRVARSATYPCNFMIIAAMNPCPCGYFGSKTKQCTCTVDEIKKYQKRISGPLLDRIDIQIEVGAVKYEDISSVEKTTSTKEMKMRVKNAREIQKMRYKNINITTNSELTTPLIKKYCILTSDAQTLIEQAFDKLALSARGYTKIIKLARTIADLDKSQDIDITHISEAIGYRDISEKYFK